MEIENNIQYKQYLNLQVFIKKWRKMEIKNKILDEKEFIKNMQNNNYINIECYSKINGKITMIFLLAKSNKSINTQDIKKILNKIKLVCDVILISEYNITIDLNKILYNMKHINNIYCYKHENFNLIIPDCILTGVHKILNKQEIYQLINEDLFTTIANLPKIRENDPQCIWIGAKTGDVIEITSPSYITHSYRTYKVVVPKLGKNISVSNIIKINNTIKEEKDINDINENNVEENIDNENLEDENTDNIKIENEDNENLNVENDNNAEIENEDNEYIEDIETE
jgi:DNA-directed RNA polymerase subunit H (RpoH/RPB5)